MSTLEWRCPVCEHQMRVPLFPAHCVCGYTQYEHPAGLGDRVAAALARCGITKQRYRKAKKTVGLKDDCNCPKRQRDWNTVGNKLTRR